MTCPECGYLLSPLEKTCPRCAHFAQQASQKAPPQSDPPPLKVCPQCGQTAILKAPACPRCGYSYINPSQNQPTLPPSASTTAIQKNERIGVGFGTCTGIVLGGALILLGILFSATGIGIFIGAPLIFIGVVWGFSGPIAGMFSVQLLEAPCPYCGCTVKTQPTSPGVTCRACQQRIIIRDRHFHRLPNR